MVLVDEEDLELIFCAVGDCLLCGAMAACRGVPFVADLGSGSLACICVRGRRVECC